MRLASAACVVLVAMCCHASPVLAQERTSMADSNAATAQHRWHRFIVKYHAHTGAGQDSEAVPPRLARVASNVGLQAQGAQPVLRWERRLGVGADLVIAEPPLDHDTAQRLLRAFAEDPDVEYAEPDGMMQRAPAAEQGEPLMRGD